MLKQKFPNYKVTSYCPSGSWQTSRYIQIHIDAYNDNNLHYEYRIDSNWEGRIELHFEGDWETKYGLLIDRLINNTQNSDELIWSEWHYGYRCQHSSKINTIEELYKTMSYMIELFDSLIRSVTSEIPVFNEKVISCDRQLPLKDCTVDVFEKKYDDIVRLHLTIPNYQRIYCWEENNVKCLLNDVFEHISSNNTTPYRLGTIILHSHKGKYDIIDGQQRLVTLSLLLAEVGIKTSLLEERFSSKRSIEYVMHHCWALSPS